jgi:hypothetical protein
LLACELNRDSDNYLARVRAALPGDLLEMPVWLMWESVPAKDSKAKKVPRYADGGRRGKTDTTEDRARLVTFVQAADALVSLRKPTGLGVALGEVPGHNQRLAGLDFDNVLNGETWDPRAQRVIATTDSYSEISVSGSGAHIIGYGKTGTTKKDARGLEIYDHGRFFTISGRRLRGTTLTNIEAAAQVARELFLSPAVKEGSRNNTLFAFACSLRARSAQDVEGWTAVEAKNQTFDPPLSETEVKDIFARAWRYPPGASSTLNDRHAIVWVGNNLYVLWRNEWNDGLPRLTLRDDTVAYYENQLVNGANPFKRWIKSPDRAEVKIVFEPGRDVGPEKFNLWRGFAVEPRPGDCSLFFGMVREVICSGDEALYRYVMAWVADAVQNPSNRPGVVLVLKGKQGTGKGTFAHAIGHLFGDHYVYVSRAEHVTGKFNAHHANKLLMFADEALFAGEKSSHGALKGLITEEVLAVEMKGRDVIKLRNYLRIIMASNEDWVVPAAIDDRRFAVIEVSDLHKKDTEYFGRLKDQLTNGGYGALLHHLLNFDLTDVDLRALPQTEARLAQQLLSLGPIDKWWHGRLEAGAPTSMRDDWVEKCPKSEMYEDYVQESGNAGARHRGTGTEFGMRLYRIVPGLGQSREKDTTSGTRRKFYKLPPLAECRASFEKLLGQELVWPDESVADRSTNEL